MLAKGFDVAQNVADTNCHNFSWSKPQLRTQDLLLDCKGPNSEWLVQRPDLFTFELEMKPVPADHPAAPNNTQNDSASSIALAAAGNRQNSGPTSSLSSATSSPTRSYVLLETDESKAENGILTPFRNPVFDSCCQLGGQQETSLFPFTPQGCDNGESQATVSPITSKEKQYNVRLPEAARSLEAQLVFAESSMDVRAALAALQHKLDASAAENAQLREQKGGVELRATVLQDELQIALAALDASQHSRRKAELQCTQAINALQHAITEKDGLLQQLDADRQRMLDTNRKLEHLEYLMELSQSTGGEGSSLPNHHNASRIGDAAGAYLDAELQMLKSSLAEANTSKAVISAKLRQCKTDNAQLVGRLQASQSRHAGDLTTLIAASEANKQQVELQMKELQEDNERLQAQVQFLQQQANTAVHSDRLSSLLETISKREDELANCHMELAHVQAKIHELLDSEKRCKVLENRLSTLEMQIEAMAEKLHAAQSESHSWRESMCKLSDELAACTLREAQAKSALLDTADKLLVQQQLCEGQEQELELLRGKLAKVNSAKQQQRDNFSASAKQLSVCHEPPQHGIDNAETSALGDQGSVPETSADSCGIEQRQWHDDSSPKMNKMSKFSWLKGLRQQ